MKPATRARSLLMQVMVSDGLRAMRHQVAGRQRQLTRRAPTVHYFHEVDDPFSHLAVQKLDALRQQYDISWKMHLCSGEDAAYRGDAGRYYDWARRDAASIAPFYGTSFPDGGTTPTPADVRAASAMLAPLLDSQSFSSAAFEAGEALWQGHPVTPGTSSPANEIARGNALRRRLGHYAGAMFYFEGEWYWGLDRLYHLEQRLDESGYARGPVCVPRPTPESATGLKAGNVTLEYFPSLRSPYTAISFARTMDLVDRSGVTLVIRPVMPMMMRGVPAPRRKQMYIITDSKREADAAGVPFGRIVDPFGEPVRRAFSLLPLMRHEGKLREYVGAYLEAAWARGVDVTSDVGIRQVIESIGVPWSKAAPCLGSEAGEPELAQNVADMLAHGLWGVPSFRVSGGSVPGALACWGQDRLWRIETEITRRAAT